MGDLFMGAVSDKMWKRKLATRTVCSAWINQINIIWFVLQSSKWPTDIADSRLWWGTPHDYSLEHTDIVSNGPRVHVTLRKPSVMRSGSWEDAVATLMLILAQCTPPHLHCLGCGFHSAKYNPIRPAISNHWESLWKAALGSSSPIWTAPSTRLSSVADNCS